MRILVAFGALALLSAASFGCSRSETPPPPPPPAAPAAATTPEDANARVRAELEKATRELQLDPAVQSPAAGATPAMSEQDMAEARKAIEGMLEGVRKELEAKSAALGKPADPNAPAAPAAPPPTAPQP